MATLYDFQFVQKHTQSQKNDIEGKGQTYLLQLYLADFKQALRDSTKKDRDELMNSIYFTVQFLSQILEKAFSR